MDYCVSVNPGLRYSKIFSYSSLRLAQFACSREREEFWCLSEYFWPQFEECAKSVRSSFPDTLTGYSVPRAVSGLNLCLVVQKIGVTGKLPLYFASGFFFQKIYFSVRQQVRLSGA